MFFNNLKSKLYTNFHNLADSPPAPKTCKNWRRFHHFGFHSSEGLQNYLSSCTSHICIFLVMLFWQKKMDGLGLHSRARDIFWVFVFLAPLYLYDIPNIWDARYTLSGYLSNCSKLSILKSGQIFYSSPFLQCTVTKLKSKVFSAQYNIFLHSSHNFGFVQTWRCAFELCTLSRDKQDNLIWFELQFKVTAHLGPNLPSAMKSTTLFMVRFKYLNNEIFLKI